MTLVLISAVHEVAPQRPAGYVERVMASGTILGDFIEIDDTVYDSLVEEYSGKASEKGPGSVLHRVLESIGIKALPSCPCLKRKALMDSWGWEECQKPERLDEIMGWLAEEATLRGLLFIPSVVRASLVLGLAVGSRVYGKG